MSARLIGNMEGQHVLMDDLESSIYVLLWTALTFSECSDKTQVPSFMEHVINPQPHGNTGGFGKVDFLQARTFLKAVKFPHRPTLDNLIDQLAIMFSVRYETKPDDRERAHAKKLLDLSTWDVSVIEIYYASHAYQYDERTRSLDNSAATISLFDVALSDHSQWPSDDCAVKQPIFTKTLSPLQVIKTGWSTTLIMRGIATDHEMHDSEEEDKYHMVGVETEMSSEKSDSTADGPSPGR
jgi:hypothetical protein